MNAKQITDQEFQTIVKENKMVLVDFWAPWCGPCRSLAPVIDELAKEFAGKVEVCKINVDENQLTAAQFGIRGIPTIKLFKNGKEVDSLSGAYPKEQFQKMLINNL